MKNKYISDNCKLSKIYSSSNFCGKNFVDCCAEIDCCVIENCQICGKVSLKNMQIHNATIKMVQKKDEFAKKSQQKGNALCQKLHDEEYFLKLKNLDNFVFEGIFIVVACQNENVLNFAKKLFCGLRAKVEIIEIDKNVPEVLENFAEVVKRTLQKNKANLGFVFDYYAEKIVAVNFDGKIVNADEIALMLAWWLNSANKLNTHFVCGNVLTSLGVENKLKSIKLGLLRVKNSFDFLKKTMKAKNIGVGVVDGFVCQNVDVFEVDALKVARVLLTIFYENKNIWQWVKENKYFQVVKIVKLKNLVKQKNLNAIVNFYRMKLKNGRIEVWTEKDKSLFVLVESTEKTTACVLANELKRKILKFLGKDN